MRNERHGCYFLSSNSKVALMNDYVDLGLLIACEFVVT